MMKAKKPSNKITLLSIVVSSLGFVFCLLACYPGFMSPDSLDQYQQAKTGVYYDWHPPIMAWIWNKLLWINDGPLPMLVLINLLYWVGVAIVAINLKRFWLSFIFLLLSFSPPLINFLGIIWKDSFLFSLLFFVSAILFSLHNNKVRKSLAIFAFFVILVLCLIAIMARHNSALAVVPILGLSLFCVFKNTKPLIALGGGFFMAIVLFCIGVQVNSRLCNNVHKHPEQQLMLYDLSGISQQAQVNLFPQYLKNKITIDTINRIYNHCDGGMYLVFSMHCLSDNNDQLDSIWSAWQTAIIQYPKLAFNHKYEAFKCLQSKPLSVNFSYIDPKSFDSTITKQNIFRKTFRNYNECASAHMFYVPNDYFIGCLIVMLVAIIVLLNTKNRIFIFPIFLGLSGFLYSASYFILSPCNELRYNYWTIGTFFISIIIFVYSILEHYTIQRGKY